MSASRNRWALLLAGALIVGAVGAGSWAFQRHQENRALLASSTALAHWERGEEGAAGVLQIEIAAGLQSSNLVTLPAPVDGHIEVRAQPGTLPPGTIVQVRNQRSGDESVNIASENGGFAIDATVERGDRLEVSATVIATVIGPNMQGMATPAKAPKIGKPR